MKPILECIVKLSLFTDIGLRALMRLAGNPETSFSTRALAEELKVSRNHLTKVVGHLARAGYVASRRGNQGGIELAKPAGNIRLGDVIAELESETSLVDCFKPGGGTCTLRPRCRLVGKLSTARAGFIAEMNDTTLAEVAYHIPTFKDA